MLDRTRVSTFDPLSRGLIAIKVKLHVERGYFILLWEILLSNRNKESEIGITLSCFALD